MEYVMVGNDNGCTLFLWIGDRQERVRVSDEALMKELQGPPFDTMHTFSLMRGPFEPCDPCYEIVVSEQLRTPATTPPITRPSLTKSVPIAMTGTGP